MTWKLKVFSLRMMEYIIRWPVRFVDFFAWLFFMERPHGRMVILRWTCGLILKTIDLLPLPQILETMMDFIKTKTRGLNEHEKSIIKSVFGNSINVELIGIDPTSIPAIRKKTVAYVTLHTINFFQSIADRTLIHEAVHLWQYKKYGSLYIIEALYAQKWGGGYAYGGEAALERNQVEGLKAFNFEQQAEIVEDYFVAVEDKEVYKRYISDLGSL